MTPETQAVWNALAHRRYSYIDEVMLHEGLSQALTAAGIEHEREVRIRGGRIDFVVGWLGIEVKIKGSSEAARRQVLRYAENERLREFLLITTQPAHRQIAGAVLGKDVYVLTIGGLSL